MKPSTTIWVVGIIVIVLLILWGAWAYSNPAATMPNGTSATSTATTNDQIAASQVLTSFGTHLKNVSLLAPNASSTIATEYGNFVDPTLLASWQANPAQAPGRQTSSPWPETITVQNIAPEQSGPGYIVQGTIVLMTSTGSAGQTPFSATVEPENGGWYITNFTEGSTTPQ